MKPRVLIEWSETENPASARFRAVQVFQHGPAAIVFEVRTADAMGAERWSPASGSPQDHAFRALAAMGDALEREKGTRPLYGRAAGDLL